MTKEALTTRIQKGLAKKLGKDLTGRMGKSRLEQMAMEIADYKEQLSWTNTPEEQRKLQDKIRYLEPRLMLEIETDRRLSKKGTAEAGKALHSALQSLFPFLKNLN